MARYSTKTTAELHDEAMQKLEDALVKLEAVTGAVRKALRTMKRRDVAQAATTPTPVTPTPTT